MYADHDDMFLSKQVISLVYSVFFFKQKKTGGRELQNLTKHQQGLSSFQLRNCEYKFFSPFFNSAGKKNASSAFRLG